MSGDDYLPPAAFVVGEDPPKSIIHPEAFRKIFGNVAGHYNRFQAWYKKNTPQGKREPWSIGAMIKAFGDLIGIKKAKGKPGEDKEILMYICAVLSKRGLVQEAAVTLDAASLGLSLRRLQSMLAPPPPPQAPATAQAQAPAQAQAQAPAQARARAPWPPERTYRATPDLGRGADPFNAGGIFTFRESRRSNRIGTIEGKSSVDYSFP